MPNFSSLAGLEVAEKFLGWGGGLHNHFHVKPNRCVVLCWDWGFDNISETETGPNVVRMEFEGVGKTEGIYIQQKIKTKT